MVRKRLSTGIFHANAINYLMFDYSSPFPQKQQAVLSPVIRNFPFKLRRVEWFFPFSPPPFGSMYGLFTPQLCPRGSTQTHLGSSEPRRSKKRGSEPARNLIHMKHLPKSVCSYRHFLTSSLPHTAQKGVIGTA